MFPGLKSPGNVCMGSSKICFGLFGKTTKGVDMKKSFLVGLFAMVGTSALAVAGPITTVPWDGHPGAVSFTFDDSEISQLDNLSAYFDANEDCKVTFFMTGGMNSGNIDKYVPMVAKGHEIGNHSATHANLTDNGVNLENEITKYKKTLEAKGVEVVVFATPYCMFNDAVDAEMNKAHIANRNCQGATKYKWDEEPNWMDISSDCYQGNTNQSKGNMSEAKSKNAWTVQLNHAVNGTFGYGISKDEMISIMDEAKKQDLWRAPMGRVAAYYRAHFTIDKAASTNVDGGFKVAWTSPHPAMPKSVPLRVKIEGVDGKTVKQKGKAIEPESDGSYIIEFMDLELEVVGAAEPPASSAAADLSSSSVAPSSSTTPDVSSSSEPQGITQNINLYKNSAASYGVFSATGVLVKTFDATFENVAEQFNALRIPRGVYYVKSLQQGQMRKMVK